MSILDTQENQLGGFEPISRRFYQALKSTGRLGNLGRRDDNCAKLDRQPARQRVHGLLRQIKPFGSNVHCQDSDRPITVGDLVARAAFRRVPTCHGVHPSEKGEGRDGAEGGVAVAYETVDAVGASHSRQWEGCIVVRLVVCDSQRCKCGESEREDSGSERCEFHDGRYGG